MQTSNSEVGAELIHRARPADNYVLIQNSTVRDRTISYLARGLLAEILSRPAGWRVTAGEMAAGSPGAGLRAVHAAFRELRAAGYLHRVVICGGRNNLRTQLHVFSTPARCGTTGCQDCPDVATCFASASQPGLEPGITVDPDVSAGRIDIAVMDCRKAVGHIEDRSTEDVDQELQDDRRSPAGEQAEPTLWAYTDEQMPRVLEIIAAQAREHLKVIIDPGDQVSRYLLRTLTRSGQRYIHSIGQYAAAVFADDPDKWRTLAVAAADHGGHVPDGSYGTWDDYATEILSRNGARARGEDYDAWTDQDFWDEHGQRKYLDLRGWADDAA